MIVVMSISGWLAKLVEAVPVVNGNSRGMRAYSAVCPSRHAFWARAQITTTCRFRTDP
jgi:hypothetical protein